MKGLWSKVKELAPDAHASMLDTVICDSCVRVVEREGMQRVARNLTTIQDIGYRSACQMIAATGVLLNELDKE